jgi:hypothetical protein
LRSTDAARRPDRVAPVEVGGRGSGRAEGMQVDANIVTIAVYCATPADWLSGATLLAALKATNLREFGEDYEMRGVMGLAASDLRVSNEVRAPGFVSAEVHHGFHGFEKLGVPPEGPVRVVRRAFDRSGADAIARALAPGHEDAVARIRQHLDRTAEVVELTAKHDGVTELLAHVLAIDIGRRARGLIELRRFDACYRDYDCRWGDPEDGDDGFYRKSFYWRLKAV